MNNNITTDTEQLLVKNNNGIFIITLNNPRYRNALSEELTPSLRRLLKKVNKDKSIRLLVIRGYGNSFCSGGNIKKMNTRKSSLSFNKKVANLEKKQIELTGLIHNMKIPTIAVITGAAAGAGFSLALACDLRIGNAEAFFVSNYSRIGLSGDYGISWFLPNLLGESKAKEIMFLNNRIYADEAKEIGLLNVLIKKDFEERLATIINEISKQSQIAMKYIKSNISSAKKNKLNQSLKLEAYHLIKSADTDEHKNAVINFKKSKNI